MNLLDSIIRSITGVRPKISPVAHDLSRRLRTDAPTRRWFLRAGLTVGTIAALSIWPDFPARAASTWFVSSVTGDNTTGTSWTTAKTSVAAAIALAAAGDTILVDHAHSFTANAAITWTPPAGGLAIISVTPSGSTGQSGFTAGATEAVGAANAAFTLAGASGAAFYINGMTVTGGTNNNSACVINFLVTASVNGYIDANTCTFSLPTAASGGTVNLGNNGTFGRLVGCTFTVGGSRTGAIISMGTGGGPFDIINPTFSTGGATKPTSMFTTTATAGGSVIFRDADLTGYAVSGGAYFAIGAANCSTQILVKNCKLSATPALTSGTWPGGSVSLTLRNVDSGNTDYVFEFINTYGTLTADTTVSKSGGSSFNSEALSWKIVTTASCSEFKPFQTPLLQVWDSSTAAETPALSVAQASGATNLNDRNAWFTLDAATSATTTQYTYYSTRNAQPFQGTAADYAADTGATWSGLTTPNKQLISKSVTPARAGRLQGRLFLGVASATVYLDAQIAGIT